jgi:hypothetical protein
MAAQNGTEFHKTQATVTIKENNAKLKKRLKTGQNGSKLIETSQNTSHTINIRKNC